MKPASDLCWKCQENNNKIIKATNCAETEKEDLLQEQQKHLSDARREREFYKEQIRENKAFFGSLSNFDVHTIFRKSTPCSFNGSVHYSFDYAQQLMYPANPQQPGPIYFKVPRKCSLFGICTEALPRQINYLIDEFISAGKGANATISLVHHFFEEYGFGECQCELHADNCCGQNKNNAFMQYFMYRVCTSMHKKIGYHFMIAGHTKFLVDGCFGLIKKKTRRTFISSLADIGDAVIDSSPNAVVNIPEFVGLEDEVVRIPTYDWTAFLEKYFKAIPNIKSYQHFRFSDEHPGIVFCKESIESDEVAINILKDHLPKKGEMPNKIKRKPVSLERREYLFKEIRQFCKDESKDLVCPKPTGSE